MKTKEEKLATSIFLKTKAFWTEKEIVFSIGNQMNENKRRLN